jgi:GNAT superfamily N-acetyltransferase
MIGVFDLERAWLGEASDLLRRACAFDRAAEVADEKLFGAWPGGWKGGALGAFDGGTLVGVAAWAGRWIRLLAVDPPARGKGAGSALVAEIERRAHAAGATRLRTGDQAGNYLSPGVDARSEDTIAWLERRGFRRVAEVENLSVRLVDNPLVTAARAAELAAAAADRGYDVKRAEDEPVAAFARDTFAPAWGFEVERALRVGGVHVAIERGTGQLAAFAAHDGNNQGLGWFGPAGTAEAHRGKGLGQALLLPCLLDVAAAGHSHGVIAWIGPREFYARTAGAVGDRRFVVLERALP